jgi:crotonobetainyl-CoA:carnitine CoA-transferase CaiB-like acyl-CoA transferase
VLKVEPKGGACFAHELSRKSWDRSKRSVELDVGDGADRASLQGLLAGADIFIHALEDAQAVALDLDEATLARDFPDLIVVALTAYGVDTPFADRPRGESLAAALLGTMIDKGSPFRPGPVYLGHPRSIMARLFWA